mgnify:CR=1 FL=1
MELFAENLRWWQLTLRWLVMLVAALLGCFAVLELRFFSYQNLVILCATVVVTFLLENYQARIAGKDSTETITFSFNSIIVYWSILWLGMPAGIIVAASVSVAQTMRGRSVYAPLPAICAANMVSAFVAAAAYSAGRALTLYLEPTLQNSTLPISLDVVAGALVMVAAHHLIGGTLRVLFKIIETETLNAEAVREGFLTPVVERGVSLVSTLLLFICFRYFGTEFGFVVLPLAMIAYCVHKLYAGSFERQTKRISDASRLHLATVEAMATAIDARDQVGVGHIRRIQIYCIGLGEKLGVTTAELDALRMGALLHDIGNLAVPDHILNKPGQLSPTELEKTKIHPLIGASIVETIEFPYPVVPLVRHHHERWDGSGYPDRLAGEDIPMTARILSVCDAYDTMRSTRPYRRALSQKEAREYLRRSAGTRFDPSIVRAFLSNLRQFETSIMTAGLDYDTELVEFPVTDGLPPLAPAQHYAEQIKSANREVFSLYSLAREFSSSLNLRETLAMFTLKIEEFVPYDTCLVFLLDDTSDNAVAVQVAGLHRELLDSRRIRVGEGATGFVLETCKRVENVDPALDFAFYPFQFDPAFRTMAALPLIAEGRLIGAVSLYSCELTHYQDEHLRLLESVTTIAADAIAKSLQHKFVETSALTDQLTGLPNARGLKAAFEKELARASRGDRSFTVLVLDLDGFKAINDSFGHNVGDRMLRKIGLIIRKQLRDYDHLARYGGDEFVALIPETSATDIGDVCRRIEAAVEEFVLMINEEVKARVGISIGAAAFPEHGSSFEQIVAHADRAMYQSKRNRKASAGRFITLHPASAAVPDMGDYAIPQPKDDLEPPFRGERPQMNDPIDERRPLASTALN